MVSRRWGVTILSILLAGICLLWIIWPHSPSGGVLTAIPERAVWVSLHRHTAGQWNQLLSSPLGKALTTAAGLDPKDVPALNADALSLLDRLAGDEVALAYAPHLGRMNAPAWVFSSWIGARAPWLRWYLSFRCPPALKPMHPMAGWPIWRVELPKNMPGVLSVAIIDGMLVGAYAPDPAGVRDVLMVVDGRMSAVDSGWVLPNEDHQWAWFKHGQRQWSGYLERPASGTPRLIATRTKATSLHADFGPLHDFAVLESVFSTHPSVALRLPQPWLSELWPEPVPQWWAEICNRLPELASREDAVLFVLGGEYSGRFNGIRIPALVLACPRTGGHPLEEQLDGLLDEVNRQHRLGLVRRGFEGQDLAWGIEGTGDDVYGHLPPQEQLAVAQRGDWFLLASSASALTTLLSGAVASPSTSPWASTLSTDTPLAAWAGLAPAGEALRVALAGWSLHLSMSDPQGSEKLRAQLRLVRNWTKALAPLGNMQLTVPTCEPLTLELQMEAPNHVGVYPHEKIEN